MGRIQTLALGLVAISALSGCVGHTYSNARTASLAIAASGHSEIQDWSFGSLEVTVPQSLVVSEENSFKPGADIVWREDPPGDRHQQIDQLMTEALVAALRPMRGSRPVRIELQVTRFHALTERTRYTYGGEHEIEFILTVRDANTGAVLRGPRPVDLTFPAAGGQVALAEEARGYFQRDAIQERLTNWALAEFRLADFLTVSN
ncbi:hypothetical protein HKCCE3408_16265 [Rhodobacterales bacterium HKCCE3408]|nr:hypothetical protein [Rhodobacterales bacterium HKCCE3408]